jgi:hypothetical protein
LVSVIPAIDEYGTLALADEARLLGCPDTFDENVR